ncbi:MAG TPA: sulfatase, partial [bacterium]|nr:sulfatase [bacterium]
LGDNRPLRGWKGDLYEGGIRVPAAMFWPDKLQPMKVTETIGVQDLYPTIAHLIGAKMSSKWNIEGMNIWSALEGGELPQRVLYWRTTNQFAVRKGNWKLVHNGESLEQGDAELFDLAHDPYEQRNLMQQFPELAEELRAELSRQAALDQIIVE